MDKFINSLNSLYVNLQDDYDIYSWLDGFYNTLAENGFMTKIPLEQETYKKANIFARAYDGKTVAELHDYKDVENTHGFHNLSFPEYPYLIFPDGYQKPYSGFRDNFTVLLYNLKNKNLTQKQSMEIVFILESILNKAIPFGTQSASTQKYLENDAEYSAEYNMDYQFDGDTPIKALFFHNMRKDCIDSLIKFCFETKNYKLALDLFIKYENSLDFNSSNLISFIKSAKNAWGKYLPNEYEPDLISVFETLPLAYLYKIKEIISSYSTVETDPTILTKTIYVLKKIFKSIEEESKKAENLKFLRTPPDTLNLLEKFKDNEFVELANFVKNLTSNSNLEDIKSVTESYKFKYILDCYNSTSLFPPFKNKLPLINWINIYKFDFEKYINVPNSHYENKFILSTIQKTIENHLLEQSKSISPEQIDELVKEFLLSAKDIEDYSFDEDYKNFCKGLDKNLSSYIEKIKDNELIYNVLGFSQHLLNSNKYQNSILALDFSGLAMQQIKIVERYLKEILVQFYPNNIYKIKYNQKQEDSKITFKSDCLDKLSADDLSQKSVYYTKQDTDNILELGPTVLALQDNYLKIKNYNGVLKPIKNRFGETKLTNNLFQNNFVFKVRNGYFHIHTMATYEDAILNSKKTAYWLLRCIDEAPGKIH